jgi:glycosyltransferase involved in cell wall biosynthesis
MKVLLVGNYEYDGSKSMQIWAHALLRELLQRNIDTQLICPKPFFGRIRPSAVGLGKWLGYIDRFLLFPGQLRARAMAADIVHLCDHGSAMFTMKVKEKPVVVTCHDMLAVRGALGEIAEMRSSFFGRLLQLWIRQGLRHATQVACVSQATFDDAARILKSQANLTKVLNGLNYPFRVLDSAEVERRLAALPEIRRPFLLHIGSNHARKNRDGVMRVFAKVAKSADLQLVFAGAACSAGLRSISRMEHVEDRVVQVVNPSVEMVEALYNRAVALLFPSRYEGFGWPAIEAQACGCPVVASDIPPLTEVVGHSGALYPLDDEAGMADTILRLAGDDGFRQAMRQRGFENIRLRFQTSRMIDDYLAVYQRLTAQRSPSASSSPLTVNAGESDELPAQK